MKYGVGNIINYRFGKPHANTSWQNHETFFSAADFLSYSNALYVTRVTDGANTAIADNIGKIRFSPWSGLNKT